VTVNTVCSRSHCTTCANLTIQHSQKTILDTYCTHAHIHNSSSTPASSQAMSITQRCQVTLCIAITSTMPSAIQAMSTTWKSQVSTLSKLQMKLNHLLALPFTLHITITSTTCQATPTTGLPGNTVRLEALDFAHVGCSFIQQSITALKSSSPPQWHIPSSQSYK